MAGSVPFFDYDADHKPLNYAFDDRHVLNFKIETTDDSSKIKSCTLDGHDITLVGIEYFMQFLINKAGLLGRHVHGGYGSMIYDYTFPLTATDYTYYKVSEDVRKAYAIMPVIEYAKEVKQKTIGSEEEFLEEYFKLFSEYGPLIYDHFREILESPFTSITGDACAIMVTYDNISGLISILTLPTNVKTYIAFGGS